MAAEQTVGLLPSCLVWFLILILFYVSTHLGPLECKFIFQFEIVEEIQLFATDNFTDLHLEWNPDVVLILQSFLLTGVTYCAVHACMKNLCQRVSATKNTENQLKWKKRSSLTIRWEVLIVLCTSPPLFCTWPFVWPLGDLFETSQGLLLCHFGLKAEKNGVSWGSEY